MSYLLFSSLRFIVTDNDTLLKKMKGSLHRYSITPSQLNFSLSIQEAQVPVNQFTCFGAIESNSRCNGEAKARQPPKKEHFCMWWPQTAGSPAPPSGADPYSWLPEGLLCLPAQSWECWGATRRPAATWDRAVKGHQPSSKTSIRCCQECRQGGRFPFFWAVY